jgi:hypothetical protein
MMVLETTVNETFDGKDRKIFINPILFLLILHYFMALIFECE